MNRPVMIDGCLWLDATLWQTLDRHHRACRSGRGCHEGAAVHGCRGNSQRDGLHRKSVGRSAVRFNGALREPIFAGRTLTRGRRPANLGLTTVVFLLNWLSTSIVVMVALALSARPASLMADLGLPIFAQVAAGVVLLDFSTGYVAHRLMHMWPAMW